MHCVGLFAQFWLGEGRREGVVSVHMYYIPKSYINHYDGSSLWVSVPTGLMSSKFERKTEPTKEEMDSLLNEAENNEKI